MSDGVEPFKRGQPLIEEPEILFLNISFLEQVHYANAEGQSEQRVRKKEAPYVQMSQPLLKNWLLSITCDGRSEDVSMKTTASGDTNEPRMRSFSRI